MNAYGIDFTFYPSVGEVIQAEKIFKKYLLEHASETQFTVGTALYTSPEIIIKCALAKV